MLTTGGLFATVVRMDGDRAVLCIAEGCDVMFAKSAIASIVSPESK